MTKWTDGWLCRGTSNAAARWIVFVPGAILTLRLNDEGYWRGEWDNKDRPFITETWTLQRWSATYDFTPPAKGKKVYVSIQL